MTDIITAILQTIWGAFSSLITFIDGQITTSSSSIGLTLKHSLLKYFQAYSNLGFWIPLALTISIATTIAGLTVVYMILAPINEVE